MWKELVSMIVGFNIQSTGLNPKEDRMVEFGAVGLGFMKGEFASSFVRSAIVQPDVPIPSEASNFHGVTDAVAEAQGVSVDEALETIELMLEWITGRGYGFAVFNAPWGLTLLRAEFERNGFTHALDVMNDLFVLDPLVLDKHISRRPGSRTYPSQLQYYNLNPEVITGDEETSAAVKGAAGAGMLALDIMRGEQWSDVASLHEQQVTWARNQADSLARHRGRQGQSTAGIQGEWPWQA